MRKDVFYQAMLARDSRFDGKFYVAVKTTGIYCRPICPAKPKRENVEFFVTSAQAEAAGYRPCMRCRPESAPLSPAWFGKSAVVRRALRQIASNGIGRLDENRFAAQFGVSARHLRRLFEDEVGLTPKQIADQNRLGFARKLIVETEMPMTAIALTSGFASLRRFNDAFRKRFKHSPTHSRKAGTKDRGKAEHGIELRLSFRPPYDWNAIHGYFDSHRIPGVERTDGGTLERVFRIGKSIGYFSIRPSAHSDSELALRIVTENPRILFDVVRRVRKMFDLDSDPVLIANSFSNVPVLSEVYAARPGLRVARGWDPFEVAVHTILGQLVSRKHASNLMGQLVSAYGERIKHPVSGESACLFPTASALRECDLAEVKTTQGRRRAIRELARRVCEGRISLSDAQDPRVFRSALLEIPGVGPWSAEYISLRAIGDTDAFPATDLVLKRALDRHSSLDLDPVKPWRAYAAIYLWNELASKEESKE